MIRSGLFDRLFDRLSERLITSLKSNFYFKIIIKRQKFFVFRVLRILAVILTPKPSKLNDWNELFDKRFDRLSERLITRLKSNFYFKIHYKLAKILCFSCSTHSYGHFDTKTVEFG